MIDKSVSEVSKSQERQVAHVIHYNMSYVVQGAEHGNDGAIVLLHDIPAGALAWADTMCQPAATGRAVYAISLLGYGQSYQPWAAETSNWGHAAGLKMLFEPFYVTT